MSEEVVTRRSLYVLHAFMFPLPQYFCFRLYTKRLRGVQEAGPFVTQQGEPGHCFVSLGLCMVAMADPLGKDKAAVRLLGGSSAALALASHGSHSEQPSQRQGRERESRYFYLGFIGILWGSIWT